MSVHRFLFSRQMGRFVFKTATDLSGDFQWNLRCLFLFPLIFYIADHALTFVTQHCQENYSKLVYQSKWTVWPTLRVQLNMSRKINWRPVFPQSYYQVPKLSASTWQNQFFIYSDNIGLWFLCGDMPWAVKMEVDIISPPYFLINRFGINIW